MKGSGKSALLHDKWVAEAPRVISLDWLDETRAKNPDAIPVNSLPELLEALDVAAGYERWHIVAALDDAEIAPFFELMAPRIGFDQVSYSRAVGGVAIECGECDLIAPNNRTPPAVESAFKRGRHHLLDLYMATQRPAACARIVTSQADVIVAFQQTEPRDLAFIGAAISRPVAEIVAELPLHHYVYHNRGGVEVLVCGEDRRPYRALTLAGKDLPRPGAMPALAGAAPAPGDRRRRVTK